MVRCLLVGGHAVAAHGYPRYTKDLDLWLDPTPENAERVLAALAEFGFGGAGATPEDFSTPGRVIQLGVEPHRIVLLTEVEGLEFAACYSSRAIVDLAGIPVPVLNLQDLIHNKEVVGRPQDLADAAALRGERSRRAPRS